MLLIRKTKTKKVKGKFQIVLNFHSPINLNDKPFFTCKQEITKETFEQLRRKPLELVVFELLEKKEVVCDKNGTITPKPE